MEAGTGRFIGIDLAKRSMEICILSAANKAPVRTSYRTDAAGCARLAKLVRQEDLVAMEACAFAFVLTRRLTRETGCRVLVLNPGKLAVIYQSTRKTDKEDAYKLANLIQRYEDSELPVVAVPTECEERMRTVVSMKRFVTKARTSQINRLHALFVQAGVTDLKKSDLASAPSRARERERLEPFLHGLATMIEEELSVSEAQLAKIDAELKEMVCKNDLAPFVLSMPGVGVGVAAVFLAYVGDGRRFSSPAQVANYCGLVPRIDCSGETNRYGAITKEGCRAIRGTILQATWSLSRCKDGGRLKQKFLALCERKGKTKSAVAIARRMVGLLWILVTRKEFYSSVSREALERKFKYYGVKHEGWESAA